MAAKLLLQQSNIPVEYQTVTENSSVCCVLSRNGDRIMLMQPVQEMFPFKKKKDVITSFVLFFEFSSTCE